MLLRPCETLISTKPDINDKLQGSVATYVTCGGIASNFLIGEYLANLQAKTWLSHVLQMYPGIFY